jgi:hypothetical protein
MKRTGFKRKPKKADRKPRPPNVSSLIKKLDLIFSRFIRWRDKWTCFTCDKRGGPGQIQNGHFVSRKHHNVRFDEMNCHAQCVGCNVFKYGNMAEYSYRLLKKYGQKEFDDLIARGRQTKQFTIQELQSLIEYYEAKVNELENAKGQSNRE